HGADPLALQKDRVAQHVRRADDRRGDDFVFADAEAPRGNSRDRHSPPALSGLRRRAAAWLRRRSTRSSLQRAAISVSFRRSALTSSAPSSSVLSLSRRSRVHVATRPRGSTRSFGGLITGPPLQIAKSPATPGFERLAARSGELQIRGARAFRAL